MIAMVVDGQPRACIVVSDSASLVERHAAAELTKYICQMSGAQLPVETTPSDNKTNIYIGRAAPTEGLDISEETLGFDGYMVKTNWTQHRFGRDQALLMPLCDLSPSDEASRFLRRRRSSAAAVIGDRSRVKRRVQTTVRMAKQVCRPLPRLQRSSVVQRRGMEPVVRLARQNTYQYLRSGLASTLHRYRSARSRQVRHKDRAYAVAGAELGDDAATLRPRTDVRYPLLARGHLAHAMARYRAWINALLRWRSDRRILAQVPGINWLKGANCAL